LFPTVQDGCRSGMRALAVELFGPVLAVEGFRDEEDAVRLANDTTYGLAGAVWTQDAGRAQRVARRLRHSTVWINDYHPYVPQAEWGGFKQSGLGRELGSAGLDEYRETKHIWQNIRPTVGSWSGEAEVNFLSRSRMSNRNDAARWPRPTTRLRACWVVHSSVSPRQRRPKPSTVVDGDADLVQEAVAGASGVGADQDVAAVAVSVGHLRQRHVQHRDVVGGGV
jgi:hypothetical protein